MKPVQKPADSPSVASNGAKIITDAGISNNDERHASELAPTGALYGVLHTIGVDVAYLLRVLGRFHDRVRRLAAQQARTYALLARTGQPFRREVLAGNRKFVARLQKQGCLIPAGVDDAVAILLDALTFPVWALNDCHDGVPAGTPSGAAARPPACEGADRRGRTPSGDVLPHIDLFGGIPADIHDNSMLMVGRRVYTRVLTSLRTCSVRGVRYNGHHVATMRHGGVRMVASAEMLADAFMRSVCPCWAALRQAVEAPTSVERPPRRRSSAMSGPSALVLDDGTLTSLAPRRALFLVLRAIGVDIPGLFRLLFRLHDRVLLLKERRAKICEIQALAGRSFYRKVSTAFQQFSARVTQQGHAVPDDAYYATGALFSALEVPVNHLTDRFEGGPTDEAACANDRTQARYAADRRRLAPHAATHRRIAPGAATGAIQQRYMPHVRRTLYQPIVRCLESYEGPALEFNGRRIVNMIDSEVAARGNADILTAAYVQTLFPLWGATTTPELVRKSRSRHRGSSR